MKRLVALLAVLAIVFLFTAPVPAEPAHCPYCGVPANTNIYFTDHAETYKVPCSHDKFGTDKVTINYTIGRGYCVECGHIRYERWTEKSRTTQCLGWVNPDIPY